MATAVGRIGMRLCFWILALGAFLFSKSTIAVVPTADVPGTTQTATEVSSTTNNVEESSSQVSQLQSTAASVGTSKKSISEYIADQKKKLEDKMEKIAEYKEKVEDYKAKAEAYKADAEAKIAEAQSKVEDAKSKVEDAKSKVEDAKSKVEDAKSKVEDAKSKVEDAQSKLEDQQNKGDDAATEEDDPNKVGEEDTTEDGSQATIIDTPISTPSRQPIINDSASSTEEEGSETKLDSSLQGGSQSENLESNTQDIEAADIPENDNNIAPQEQESFSNVSSPVNTNVTLPTRTTFKTSYGYGKIHQSYPLAFASASLGAGDVKGGTTENNVFIVPESIGLYCDLDYDKVSEDEEAFDNCLKKVNAIAYSEETEENSKTDIENAQKDIDNGLVEYIAAAYFEAMEIYNESTTFKNNVVDPVETTEISTIDSAWGIAKEANRILGTRYNTLNRLWSRNLGIMIYNTYKTEGFKEVAE